MHRGQEVEQAGIDDRLPAPVRPVDLDARLPELLPGGPLVLPHPLPAAIHGQREEPGGMIGRVGVSDARDERAHLADAVGTTSADTERVCRRHHPALVGLALALRCVCRSEDLRPVGQTAGADLAVAVPDQQPSGRSGVTLPLGRSTYSGAPVDSGRIEPDADDDVGRAIDGHADLLQRDRRQLVTAELHDLEPTPWSPIR
jgi:hypothetical protein